MTTEPPKRRWYQFRLRTLLIAILVLSVPLSWLGARLRKARRQKEAVETIKNLNGDVGWDSLEEMNRYDYYETVVIIDLSYIEVSDVELERLEELTSVRNLSLEGTQITNAGLEHLKGLTNLRWLSLRGTQVTSEGVKKLQEALPNCKIEY